MKSKLLQKRLSLLVIVSLILTLCYCREVENRVQIEIGGKKYSYRKIEHKIKDLETEPLNTRWIETKHFMIEYSYEFESHLPNMVKVSEDAYEKVSKDLKLKISGTKPQISYLSSDELERLKRQVGTNFVKNFSAFYRYRENQIIIGPDNLQLEDQYIDYTLKVIIHEVTHLLLDQIRRNVDEKIRTKMIKTGSQAFRLFDEGLAQYESRSDSEIVEALTREFPEGKFLTFEKMVFGDLEVNYFRSTLEFWTLVKFLEHRWGKETLLRIVHSLKKLTVEDAIEINTKTSFPQFENQWLQYMRSLTYKKTNKLRGESSCGKNVDKG